MKFLVLIFLYLGEILWAGAHDHTTFTLHISGGYQCAPLATISLTFTHASSHFSRQAQMLPAVYIKARLALFDALQGAGIELTAIIDWLPRLQPANAIAFHTSAKDYSRVKFGFRHHVCCASRRGEARHGRPSWRGRAFAFSRAP